MKARFQLTGQNEVKYMKARFQLTDKDEVKSDGVIDARHERNVGVGRENHRLKELKNIFLENRIFLQHKYRRRRFMGSLWAKLFQITITQLRIIFRTPFLIERCQLLNL
jgi:hypothetical protein